MDHNDIEPYTEEDHARFKTGLRNAILIMIPFWALVIWAVAF